MSSGTTGGILSKFSVRSGATAEYPYNTYINRLADETISIVDPGDHTYGLSLASWDALNNCWVQRWGRLTTTAYYTGGRSTGITCGRSTALAGGEVIFGRGLFVGRTLALSRKLTNDSAIPTTGEWAAGDLVLNNAPLIGEPWGWRCILAGTPGTWQPLRDLGSQETIATNADFSRTPGTSAYHAKHTGTLTADRAATLSKTAALVGLSYKITRTGSGTFNLNVLNGAAGPTLKALATNTWGEFAYDGTDYYLAAYGAL
jgi:hypothetical protein